jgi:hypothetical protein
MSWASEVLQSELQLAGYKGPENQQIKWVRY